MAAIDPPPDETVIEPLCTVESPEVEVHTYCFPAPAETGDFHEKLCDEPTSHTKLFGRLLNE